jgi:hypothetical protein
MALLRRSGKAVAQAHHHLWVYSLSISDTKLLFHVFYGFTFLILRCFNALSIDHASDLNIAIPSSTGARLIICTKRFASSVSRSDLLKILYAFKGGTFIGFSHHIKHSNLIHSSILEAVHVFWRRS